MAIIQLEIKTCKECPHFEERRMYTADSFEHANDWFCKKENGKKIQGYVEWHEEKVNYMKIAAGMVGYGFDKKGLDMLVSIYDLVLEKKGETDLHSIVKVECAVEEREKVRVEAKKLKEKSDSPS